MKKFKNNQKSCYNFYIGLKFSLVLIRFLLTNNLVRQKVPETDQLGNVKVN